MRNKQRRVPQQDRKAAFNGNAVIDLNHFRDTDTNTKPSKYKRVEITPRNLRQEDYLAHLENPQKDMVFALGPAGTGKTLLATLWAVKQLKSGEIDRIVVTRPAVSVDEQHGFLPGDLMSKMAPWTRPVFDVFREYWNNKQIESMITEGIIEVAPLAYMRGRTFTRSVVIADEMQNATPSQMKMLLTRIGDGSKFIITGDLDQHDRGYEHNGLKDFMEKLLDSNRANRLTVVKFELNHVERHPAVAQVLGIYQE
ncbi:MAG: PhoH family protein [Gammaproteobacteria bacterium]|nr:PhoH family protein [Gammaproteobacteria bacterium]